MHYQRARVKQQIESRQLSQGGECKHIFTRESKLARPRLAHGLLWGRRAWGRAPGSDCTDCAGWVGRGTLTLSHPHELLLCILPCCPSLQVMASQAFLQQPAHVRDGFDAKGRPACLA